LPELDGGIICVYSPGNHQRARTKPVTPRASETKIVGADDLVKIRKSLKAEGRTFVFTNGCFDILHLGHVNYLEFARRQGDVLAVGMNSDDSVRRLKGELRPILPQSERARLLASLESVDYVTVFNETHVEDLISRLLPDVLVKGEDRKDWVCGREIVEQHGGRVALAPLALGRSTTNVIQRVLELYARTGAV
jgi:rfaE bifunctional protein nucleotidyltransferase chain/domain